MRYVLIAGCGYVGSALARRLVEQGDRVLALRRSPMAPLPGVQAITADLTVPASLAGLPETIDSIVYAVSASGRSDAAYRDAYVTGVANLLESMARRSRPPRRLLFVSSTAVYAQKRGEWVDEDSASEPQHFSGRRLLEGEACIAAGAIASCAVRLGGIYGPGRSSLIARLRRGEARIAAGPPRYTNRIHRDDCAGVLRHLLALASLPPVVLGVDHAPAPQAEVWGWLAERMGVPAPSPGPPEAGSRQANSNKRCSNRRLLRSGYTFRYPTFREGYAGLLAAEEP